MAKIITVYNLQTKNKEKINADNIIKIDTELLLPDVIGKITMVNGEIIYTKETILELEDLINS